MGRCWMQTKALTEQASIASKIHVQLLLLFPFSSLVEFNTKQNADIDYVIFNCLVKADD